MSTKFPDGCLVLLDPKVILSGKDAQHNEALHTGPVLIQTSHTQLRALRFGNTKLEMGVQNAERYLIPDPRGTK